MRTFALSLLTSLCSLWAAPTLRAHHLDCKLESELTRLAVNVVSLPELPRGAGVQAALRDVGSDLPNVALARFSPSSPVSPPAWLGQRQTQGAVVCGFARLGAKTVLVVGDRLATLRPTQVIGRFEVRLKPQVKSAYGFALLQNGSVRHAPVGDGKLVFDNGSELLSVQLVGHTRDGPLPLAQWEAKQASTRVTTSPEVDPYVWQADLFRTLYEANGLQKPARRNQKLERVAQKYGEAVCVAGRASHSADGTSALGRIAEAGLRARDVGEVVVRAPTIAGALGAFLRSASHRLVLLDRRMTDVGFGVHRTDDGVCVVGLFASWPRPAS